MATYFEGANALTGHAWESTAGVPVWNGTRHDFRFNSEGLSTQAPLIQSPSIKGGRQRSRGFQSKKTTSGPLAVTLEPQGHGYLLAAFQKKGDTVATLTGGQSYRHKLSPSQTVVNHDKTSTLFVSRNDRMPARLDGCLLAGFGIQTTVENLVMATFNISAQRASYWPLATVVSETSTPVRPVIRGFPKYAVASAADADLYLTVSNVSGQVLAKIGASGTDTAAQTITAGTWTTLLYHPASTDVALGEADDPVQVYCPAFTNWTSAGTPDQWRFKFNHVDNASPWTPSFPTIEAMNEIHATITIDGTEVKLREVALNAALGIDPNFSIGGRYSSGLLETGQRQYSGQLSRRELDNSLRNRLEAGEPFELDVTITSRVNIGSSTDPYRLRFVAPLCVFSGASPNVGGPAILEGSFPFDCYPDPSDGSHPDELTVYLDNGVADMTT